MLIFVWQFYITFSAMEDLDARLFIVDVEVSCWQDQLRQAVSICFILSFKLFKLFFIKHNFLDYQDDDMHRLIFHFDFLSNFNFYTIKFSS